MDEEKSNFRATLFLEEQFSFLQNNNAQEEDIVNHSTDVSVDDQVGGPLTTTEDIFIEGMYVFGSKWKCNIPELKLSSLLVRLP